MSVKKFVCIFAWAAALISTSTLTAQSTKLLYVPETIPFAKGIRVPDKVKEECRLEENLADDIAKAARSVYDKVVRQKPSGPHHYLEVEITDAFGAGGGAFSGPKRMEMQGKLKTSGGKVLGSFRGERHSMGGIRGLGGTCSVFKKVTKVLGEDLAKWLVSPEMDTTFGE